MHNGLSVPQMGYGCKRTRLDCKTRLTQAFAARVGKP